MKRKFYFSIDAEGSEEFGFADNLQVFKDDWYITDEIPVNIYEVEFDIEQPKPVVTQPVVKKLKAK